MNFADNLHHWFGEGLCQWQLPEPQFHKTVCIPDHVFIVQLVQFFGFLETVHILTHLPVTDYSHKSTVLLTPKIIHKYQVYKKYVHNLNEGLFY